MIRFDKAGVTYPNGVVGLKDLDLTIDDGEFIVIVGLSGAGKSTLIRAINGLVPLTSGSLEVNGEQVTDLNRAGLRSPVSLWRRHLGCLIGGRRGSQQRHRHQGE